MQVSKAYTTKQLIFIYFIIYFLLIQEIPTEITILICRESCWQKNQTISNPPSKQTTGNDGQPQMQPAETRTLSPPGSWLGVERTSSGSPLTDRQAEPPPPAHLPTFTFRCADAYQDLGGSPGGVIGHTCVSAAKADFPLRHSVVTATVIMHVLYTRTHTQLIKMPCEMAVHSQDASAFALLPALYTASIR